MPITSSKGVGIWNPGLKLLAWFGFIITLLSAASATVLVFTNLQLYPSVGMGRDLPLFIDILLVLASTAGVVLTASMGLIILYRSSNWQIGWLLILLGGFLSINALVENYTDYAFNFQLQTTLPFKWPAAWLQHLAPLIIFYIFLIALPLLFPNGRPLSPRWSMVFRLSLVYLSIVTLLIAFGKGPLENVLVDMDVRNPYGFIPVGEFGWYEGSIGEPVYNLLLLVFSVLAIGSMILRYRRAQGQERLQFKWVAYALAIWVLGLWIDVIGFVFEISLLSDIGWTAWHIAILGVPLAVGFAILKYRLYDIDQIIRRTLQYSLLTGILVGVYFGGVVILQEILSLLTGSRDSPLVTVITTLVIAALFQPLRQRVQATVDRRFYRSKYDAERTLEAFAEMVRDQVAMKKINDTLLQVVTDTMQPTHVSLWLREGKQSASSWDETN